MDDKEYLEMWQNTIDKDKKWRQEMYEKRKKEFWQQLQAKYFDLDEGTE